MENALGGGDTVDFSSVCLRGWRLISPTAPTSLQPDSPCLLQQGSRQGEVVEGESEREEGRGKEGW